MSESTINEFQRLFDIIAQLRGENGCPWDKKQTPILLYANTSWKRVMKLWKLWIKPIMPSFARNWEMFFCK